MREVTTLKIARRRARARRAHVPVDIGKSKRVLVAEELAKLRTGDFAPMAKPETVSGRKPFVHDPPKPYKGVKRKHRLRREMDRMLDAMSSRPARQYAE